MRWLWAVSVLVSAQSFERDLQPVFRKHCYACHAANVKMGSLDVETHEGLLRGGNRGTILVPGKAADSRLYLTLTGALEPVMPMGDDKLTAAELDTVKRWIDAGAPPPIQGIVWRAEIIAAGFGGELRVYSATGRLMRKIPAKVGQIRAVALSHDGERVAAQGAESTRYFDTSSGRELPAQPLEFQSARTAIAPDSRRRATVRDDGSLELEEIR